MRRLMLAWLLALPLVAVGSQLAHWLGYSLATPDAAARADLHAATGHGYLVALPVLVTASLGLLFAVVLLLTFDESRGRASVSPVSPATLLEKPVLFGLLLQLPFAMAACGIAFVLTRVARRLGRALASAPPSQGFGCVDATWPACSVLPPTSQLLATTPARSPPVLPLFPVS